MAIREAASFLDATGPIDYNMTNDYMFRYILQKNKKVLKGLLCSLLHLKPEEIKSIEILNPIDLSKSISGKDFILDIKIVLNSEKIINLEMQVKNEYNWPDRSLVYLCRSFDQLYSGQDYDEALPAIHIGFVDYTLYPDSPEFYATYKLLNVKNHHVYSDKFILSVVDLNHIELATEEDKAYGIDYWARIFKAKTWEELKMLAKDNEYLEEAAKAVYVANADDIVRWQCLARADAERRERTLERNSRLAKEALVEAQRNLETAQTKLVESQRILGIAQAMQAEKDAIQEERDAIQAEKDAIQAERDVMKADIEALKSLVMELQEKLTNAAKE